MAHAGRPSELRLEAGAPGAKLGSDETSHILFAFGGDLDVILIGLVLEGCILSAAKTILIRNCTFTRDSASFVALPQLDVSAGRAELQDTLFVNASTGALHVTGGAVIVRSSVFSGNRAPRGAAAIVSSGILHVESTLIENNEADEEGGATVRKTRSEEPPAPRKLPRNIPKK